MIYILFIILYIFIGAIIYAILEDKLYDDELKLCSIFWPIAIIYGLCRLIGYIPYKLTRKVVEFFKNKNNKD